MTISAMPILSVPNDSSARPPAESGAAGTFAELVQGGLVQADDETSSTVEDQEPAATAAPVPAATMPILPTVVEDPTPQGPSTVAATVVIATRTTGQAALGGAPVGPPTDTRPAELPRSAHQVPSRPPALSGTTASTVFGGGPSADVAGVPEVVAATVPVVATDPVASPAARPAGSPQAEAGTLAVRADPTGVSPLEHAPGDATAGPAASAAGQPSMTQAAVPPMTDQVVVRPMHAPDTAGGTVLDQLAPVVTRLVTRGDGTHRLTLRLHPEELGEVRVTVTVKDHVVEVIMSAGSTAAEALRGGSSQLRALLDQTGGTTGQVVVRELVTTPQPPTAVTTSAGPGGGSTGSPGDPGQGAHAHPREDTSSGHGSRRPDHARATPDSATRTERLAPATTGHTVVDVRI